MHRRDHPSSTLSNDEPASTATHVRPAVEPDRRAQAPALDSDPTDLRRVVGDPQSARPGEILTMQRRYGNRSVRRLVERTEQETAPPSTVRQGSQGPDVVRLQDRLNELGNQLVADGVFGPKTRAAVVAFQSANGLAADGIVGPMTWNALGVGGATPVPTAPPTPVSPGTGETTPGTEGKMPATEEAVPPTPLGGETQPSSQRETAVALALAEAGKVEAYSAGGTDPETGKTTRLGWERLDVYFESAYGGRGGGYDAFQQSAVKFLNGPKLQSWCGLFVVWALKSAGVPLGNWKIGSGISALISNSRGPQSYTPQVGDIGYLNAHQHHCLVIRVEGDMVITIDGNTRGDSGATGGQIGENARPRSAFAAFYIPPVP
jgi:peptidoglycan hydrolase-like protein with peptidoglycan-binding domain